MQEVIARTALERAAVSRSKTRLAQGSMRKREMSVLLLTLAGFGVLFLLLCSKG